MIFVVNRCRGYESYDQITSRDPGQIGVRHRNKASGKRRRIKLAPSQRQTGKPFAANLFASEERRPGPEPRKHTTPRAAAATIFDPREKCDIREGVDVHKARTK